jgi:hypothetical protein
MGIYLVGIETPCQHTGSNLWVLRLPENASSLLALITGQVDAVSNSTADMAGTQLEARPHDCSVGR